MKPIRNKVNQITGIVMIVLNSLWTGHWIWLFYGYHFTSILWFYMYPDWVLILNILIGLIGIYIGVKLTRNRISVLKALTIVIPLFISGLFISYYIPM